MVEEGSELGMVGMGFVEDQERKKVVAVAGRVD
jgi:hypothetical protein